MNQEQNNLNQNNFNTQGNNGIPNNQPLQNNQNVNVNQPTFNSQQQENINYQQPIMQESTPQPINSFESGNANNQSFNSKPSKKMNLGLIIGIVVTVIVVGIGIFMLFGNNESKNNNSTNTNGDSSNIDIIYYDENRELKDNYTFREAVSKFAFKVNETTLIFEAKNKTSLENITTSRTYYDELAPTQFNYKQDIYTSLGAMYLGESNSTNLQDFISNFNNGILSDKATNNVEDVKIIESTDDYVFASWIKKSNFTSYEYYFAKKIGNIIYYAYHSTTLTPYDDTRKSLLLEEFKELFSCLTEDDGKEPYIYDKIINVPLTLNKKIKDVNYISYIINFDGSYADGRVAFADEDDENITDVELEYGASDHYDKIDWTKTLDSNIKYSDTEYSNQNENIFGIKENNNTQIFYIDSNYSISNYKELNNFISKYLIEK